VNDSLESISIDHKVLGFCLKHDFFNKVKNILEEDMFSGQTKELFKTILFAQTNYEKDLTKDELFALHVDRHPAMPATTKKDVMSIVHSLPPDANNHDLQMDVVKNFWMRDRARLIGEKAISIFTGQDVDFGELQRIMDTVEDGRMENKTTYTECDLDLEELLDDVAGEPDFPFDWNIIGDVLQGMWRGNLGIIFARPEVGKTTFCAYLCSKYVKQKKTIIYWANEEPAKLVKLRMIQSYFAITKKEMNTNRRKYIALYREHIKPYLRIMDAVGTSIEEINDFAQLNKPDIMFCDQLDKFKVRGEFGRGDERLKEIYVLAREVAKRNNLLMWAISQASYDAHDRAFIDYAMLDNSKTGKAGEADVIIGLGKTGSSEVENNVRHICISKNKINGWHGMLNCNIDVEHGVYY
jgi:replicative DNA helicase|tara:strand:- start:1253 stop:2482 length:1230 start_codon:yes stop_codon:yes gene_type:complete